MGGNIPSSIKQAVLRDWLLGIPRETIAINNDISSGSVSNIILQSKTKIPDLDLLRQISSMTNKKEIDLSDVGPTIRLKKIMEQFGIFEEKMEVFIEAIKIHCFKKEIDEKEFISKVDKVFSLLSDIGLSIDELFDYIEKAQILKQRLDEDIEKGEKSLSELYTKYSLTEYDINEYWENWPLQNTIKNLRQEIEKRDMTMRMLKETNTELLLFKIAKENRSVLEKELDAANKKLAEDEYEPVEVQELDELSKRLFEYPSKYVDVIEIMQDRV
jgi:hypothetical protein